MTGSSAEVGALPLRYGSLVVRVEAEPGHLAWLEEFLSPPFEREAGARPDRLVRLVTDAARHGETLRRGADPGGARVPTFVLDTAVVELPRWRPAGADPALTLWDPAFGVFYTIGPPGHPVEILAAPGNGSARNALMRVVRELALVRAQRAGALVLHAAAVHAGGRVVALAGPKGAGKTTLLIHLLRDGAGLVANDRLVVWGGGRTPEARGMPTTVKVRRDTLEWFPEVRARFFESPYHHRQTLAEAARRPPPRHPAPDGYWSLSGAQLCALLAAPASPGGRLVAVVFPRIVAGRSPLTLRALPPDAVDAALATARLGPAGWDPARSPWREVADGGAPGGATNGGRAAVATIPGFVCEVGETAYRDPGGAATLRALLDG